MSRYEKGTGLNNPSSYQYNLPENDLPFLCHNHTSLVNWLQVIKGDESIRVKT